MADTPRTCFRIPEALLYRMDEAAERAGKTRTAWALGAFESRLALDDNADRLVLVNGAGTRVASRPASKPRLPPATASRHPDSPRVAEQCPHPIARRIGKQCAACGGTVGRS